MPNRKMRIIFALGAALVLFGLFVMYKSYKSGKLNEYLDTASTTPEVQEIIVNLTPVGLPAYSGISVGKLNADPALLTQVPPDKFTEHKKELERLAAKVNDDPTDIESWLAVAAIKKFWNDFEGARDIWEYVTILAPENPIAFYNLGNLSKLVDRNFPAAESYYLKVITIEPTFTPASLDLAELYWDFIAGRKSEAIKVLESSLKVSPEDVTTLVTLSRYFKEMGDLEKAILYAKRALALYPDDENLKRAVSELEGN